MDQLQLAIKGSVGNIFSSSVPLVTATGDDLSNPLVTAVIQIVIAIATIISLFKKPKQNGKN